MATWKKLVVSGSNISQLNNDAGYLTSVTAQHAFTTASFNGTDLLADGAQGTLNFASGSTGLNIVANAGSDTLTFDLVAVPNTSLENDGITIAGQDTSLGGSITADTIAGQISAGTITNSQLANDGITFGTDDVSLGGTVTQMSLTGFTGSFSGSIAGGTTAVTQTQGDNSTKVATTAYVDAAVTAEDLDFAGDSGTGAVDLDSQTFTFTGGNAVSTTAANQALTIAVNVDDSSIEVNGSDQLQVKASGVTNAMLANDGITIAGQDISLGGSITADTIAGQISATTITNAQLVNDGITIGDQDTSLGGSVLNNLTHSATGSFTGSFVGDGSGLTGLVTELSHEGDSGTGTVDLLTQTLDIAGGTNINTVAGAQTITVNLDDSITVTDATVNGNLTVLGTASFQHETNLEVADRFILLASGSSTTGDGGIIVQQATQDVGEVFGFDGVTGDSRWGIGQNLHASSSAFTAQAFMAAVLTGNASSDAGIDAIVDDRYEAKGNLFIGDDEDIWIYS